MHDPFAFALAVLALLATPGPTNTLLAAAGASDGVRPALRLVSAELAGYLVSISLLLFLAGPAVAASPALATALKLAAGAWLAVSAVRLWREAGDGFAATPRPVTLRRVFVTTLLNPKALVFALVLIPPGGPAAVAPWLAFFSGLVALVGSGWVVVGGLIARSGGRAVTPRRVSRTAALVLAAFATLLAGSAVAAVI